MVQREPVMRQQSKPRKKAKPLKAPERSGFFPVVTSNVLNMICVTTVVATVLVVLLGVAKSGLGRLVMVLVPEAV